MRALRISGLLLLVVILGGTAWFLMQKPKPQTMSLPDGSQLTLLKVTYGTNHVCRYQTGWQELLHPLLPKKLQANLSPRVMKCTSRADTMMVWIRHDGARGTGGWPPPFSVAVVEGSGLESQLIQSANMTVTLASRKGTTASAGAGPATVGQVSGWDLPSFPRRAKQFRIRVYSWTNGKVERVGEFTIQNPVSGIFTNWSAESLPAVRQTNELEMTLVKLETGLTGKEVGSGPAGEGAKSFSRAIFRARENGVPTEKWSVCRMVASNAAGEIQPGGSYSSQWRHGEHIFDFSGGLWLEETAWKLDLDVARTADFPAEELWVLKGIRVPKAKESVEARETTTRAGRELEFLGVSGPNASLTAGYTGNRSYAIVHVRAPFPMDELRIVLVEVTDDRRRKAHLQGYSSTASTGGRGAALKEMLYGFGFDIPEGATTLNITFAVTPLRHVQFITRPVLYVPPGKPAD